MASTRSMSNAILLPHLLELMTFSSIRAKVHGYVQPGLTSQLERRI